MIFSQHVVTARAVWLILIWECKQFPTRNTAFLFVGLKLSFSRDVSSPAGFCGARRHSVLGERGWVCLLCACQKGRWTLAADPYAGAKGAAHNADLADVWAKLPWKMNSGKANPCTLLQRRVMFQALTSQQWALNNPHLPPDFAACGKSSVLKPNHEVTQQGMVGKKMLWAEAKMDPSQILMALDFGLNPDLSHASAERAPLCSFQRTVAIYLNKIMLHFYTSLLFPSQFLLKLF